MGRVVSIKREVIDSLLSYAQIFHPKEGILLLRGTTRKGAVNITGTVIPPLATHSYNFSSFPFFMLPIDPSIVGVAHSHPSGAKRPSIEDLNNFYGSLMAIVAYPYKTEEDIVIFDRDGNTLKFNVI
ncbi:MAG: Mov34/MPN/PAD-1 family protein [Candidatus Bathyarchaeia archaeon]